MTMPAIVASYSEGAAEIHESYDGLGSLSLRKKAVKRWEQAHRNGNSRNGATPQEKETTTRKHPVKKHSA